MFPSLPSSFPDQQSLDSYKQAVDDAFFDEVRRLTAIRNDLKTGADSVSVSPIHIPQPSLLVEEKKDEENHIPVPASSKIKRKRKSKRDAPQADLDVPEKPKKPAPTGEQKKLKEQLVILYDPEDVDWGHKAMAEINALFSDPVRLGPPKDKAKDPLRLSSKAWLVSSLKSDILKKLVPLNAVGHPEFNSLSRYKQMEFMNRAKMDERKRQKKVPKWLYSLDVVPKNLEALQLTRPEAQYVHDIQGKSQSELGAPIQVDGDEILQRIVPLLSSDRIMQEVVPAFELVTGRRIGEVLESGRLYLGEGQDVNGYACMFSGQLKLKSRKDKPFVIQLLAKFSLVNSALQRIREYVNLRVERNKLEGKTTNVASSFTSAVLTGVKELFGENFTNRLVRSLYSDICRQLFGKDQRSSVYRQSILGHSDPYTQTHYEMATAHNVSGPYDSSAPKVASRRSVGRPRAENQVTHVVNPVAAEAPIASRRSKPKVGRPRSEKPAEPVAIPMAAEAPSASKRSKPKVGRPRSEKPAEHVAIPVISVIRQH